MEYYRFLIYARGLIIFGEKTIKITPEMIKKAVIEYNNFIPKQPTIDILQDRNGNLFIAIGKKNLQ
jgi:hypothetical protein